VRLPFNHGAPAPLFAGKRRTTIDSCWVQVVLDNGLAGWGEAYASDLDAVVSIMRNRVAPLLVGQPMSMPNLIAATERTLHNMGRSGPVLHALSGVDIALWDLRAKIEEVPLHKLLGGAKRDRVPAYASLLQYYGDVELVSHNTEAALRAGYVQVKLHERTAAAGMAARKVMGAGMPLMMDTNCAWLPDAAVAESQAMLACDPHWIEEPIWPPEDAVSLLQLKATVNVPLAAGENASSAHELVQFVKAGAVDWIQPSAIKCGGLSTLLRISEACKDQAGVQLSPQTAFFGPGFLATLHLLSTFENEVFIERLFCQLQNDPYSKSLNFSKGAFEVPQGSGLGFEPDPEALQRASSTP
jgi:L-alanine-DL-glutamate epimerase-like enolase superfamily enzyme